MNGSYKFLQLSKNDSAYDAVLILHCLNLSPGFRRFDDFKLYSLQDASPMIPASCYSCLHIVFSHSQ